MDNTNEYSSMLDKDAAAAQPGQALIAHATDQAMTVPSAGSTEAAATPAPVAGPDYSQMLQSDKTVQSDLLKQAVYAAKDVEPDRQAKVMALASKMNLPIPIVQRNYDDLAKTQQVQTTDYDKLVDQNPKVATWMQDANNAALAKTDLPGIKNLEDTVNDHTFGQTLVDTVGYALAGFNEKLASLPALAYDVAALPQNLIKSAMGEDPNIQAPDWLANNPSRVMAKNAQASFATQLPQLKESIYSDVSQGNYHRAAAAMLVQAAAGAPDLIAAIGLGMANPLYGAAYFGVSTASGRSGELRDEGVDPLTGTTNALEHGTIAGVAGEIKLLDAFKPWEHAMANVYGKQVSQAIFKDLFKTLAGTVIVQGGTGAGMSLANDISDYVTGVNPNADQGMFERATDAGAIGAGTGLALAATPTTVSGLARLRQIHETNGVRGFYEAMGSAAESTNLRKNLPEAQTQLVSQIVRDSPLENVFIDPVKFDTYFQKKDLDPTVVMQELNELPAYGAAKDTGGDIKIPYSKFLDKFGNTEHYKGLADDVRFSPEGMSVSEMAQENERMQAEAAGQPMPPSAEVTPEQSASQVHDVVASQLDSLGLDSKNADLYEAAFKTLGERMGVDPLELFNRFKLKITGKEENADALRTFSQVKSPQEIEDGVAKAFKGDDLEQRYSQLPDTSNGQHIDIDNVRNLYPEYANNGREGKIIHLDATGTPAAEAADHLLDERLKQDPGPVIMTAGGSASGKTTYAKRFARTNADATAIFDTTAANYKSVKARIKKVLGAGHEVVFDYVHAPFDQALEGNKERFKDTGRLVDPHTMAYTHVHALDTFLKLQNDFKDDPRVSFGFYQRNGKNFESSPLENANKLRYDGDGKSLRSAQRQLEKQATEALKNETDEIRNTKQRYSDQQAESNGAGDVRADQGIGGSSQGRGLPGDVQEAGTRSDESGNSDPNRPTTLKQSSDSEEPRGQIHIGAEGMNIQILKDADRSTFLHETGHFYLEVLKSLASDEKSPDQIKDDFATVQKWLGNEGDQPLSVDQHEQFARGFEAYLMEGKAPSEGLRKVFAAFKVWLTNVYRSMRNLKVELNPEVRGVFDRILATDFEIAKAQTQQHFEPLFKDPAMHGLSSEDFAKYQSAIDAARQAADDELRARVMTDITKEEKKLYKEQKSDIQSRVEAEANETRVFKARSLLQVDKLPDGSPRPEGSPKIKIDRDSLVSQFGEEILKRLPRMYSREGGMDVNLVADFLGYETGDQMVQELSNSIPKDQYVEQQTEARIKDLHPDLLTSGTMPDEAMAAIHNDQQSKVLRMELDFLAKHNLSELKGIIKNISKRVPTDSQIRDQAQSVVGGQDVRTLSPAQYRAAEARHAREAGENLAKGNIPAAFESKRLELYNHELYRAAAEARQDIKDSLKQFRKVSATDRKVSLNRDADLVSTAQAVLSAFGIGSSESSPTEILERIKRYDPEGYASAHALVEMATAAGSGNYNEISYNRFVDMKNAVKGIWDLAKSAKEIEIDGKRVAKDKVVSDLSARISELNPRSGPAPGFSKAFSFADKTKSVLLSAKAMLRRTEHWVTAMDGGDKGVFRTNIWNPVVDGVTRFRLEKQNYTERYLKDVVQPAKEVFNKKPIEATEIGYTFQNKSELLGALLHTGNESNLRKLLRGRDWGSLDESGHVDTSSWDKFVQRMRREGTLTKGDYDYIQGVWDMYEGMKPDAQRAHKRMYGYYFNEVTAQEFETPFGNYRGGYAPAIIDPNLTEDAAIRLERAEIEQVGNSYMFPTAGRGFTQSRIEAYAAPLALDLGYVPLQIDKVLRFSHLEPAVRDVSKIVMDKGFRATLAGLDSSVASEMLVPWLQRSVTQQVSNPSGTGKSWKAADWMFRKIRGNTGLNAMALNVVNTFHQTTGFSVAGTMVEPHYLRDALWSYMKDAKGIREAMDGKSDYMRAKGTQIGDLQEDINDIMMNPSKYEQGKDWVKKNGYILQRMTQGAVETVAWHGAYNKAVEGGETEQEAVRYADSVVRQTQHSSMPEDVSRFGAGTPFTRLFTMYFDYYNMKANLGVTQAGNMIRETGLKKSLPSLVGLYTAGWMIPAIMSATFFEGASGRLFNQDDEHGYMNEVMRIFFGGQANEMVAMAPVVGPIVNNQIARWNSNQYDDRLQLSPAIENLQKAWGAPAEIYSALKGGKKSPAIRDTLSLLGMLSGFPLQPLAKPIGYLTDVQQHKVQPRNSADFVRGLVTGQAGKQ